MSLSGALYVVYSSSTAFQTKVSYIQAVRQKVLNLDAWRAGK